MDSGGEAKLKKPYIVCHMMMSLDGRVDCAMVGQLTGVDEYYATLENLDLPSTLSGLPMGKTPTALTLKDIQAYENGAVWLRYLV